MSDRREQELDAVEPGMEVETTEGDLGERDITKPIVKDVVRDADGDVEKVIVEKGAVFKKQLAVPSGRVEEVRSEDERGDGGRGAVTIGTKPGEVDALTPAGAEELPAREPANPGDDDDSLLGEVQEEVPTAEGLWRKEAETAARGTAGQTPITRSFLTRLSQRAAEANNELSAAPDRLDAELAQGVDEPVRSL